MTLLRTYEQYGLTSRRVPQRSGSKIKTINLGLLRLDRGIFQSPELSRSQREERVTTGTSEIF